MEENRENKGNANTETDVSKEDLNSKSETKMKDETENIKEQSDASQNNTGEADNGENAGGIDETAEEATTNDKTADGKSSDNAQNEQTAEKEAEIESGKDARKKFFGRKEPKKDKKDIAIEELTDKHQRLMAEFQNFRTRTEKEKSTMYEMGVKTTVEKILPVIDNFERGLSTMSDEDKAAPVGQGMEMIYKQFVSTLEEIGVKPIEAVGKEFDPNFHNAVMHVEDDKLDENVVAEEFQKGYMYHDSVIRHSMVKVAN